MPNVEMQTLSHQDLVTGTATWEIYVKGFTWLPSLKTCYDAITPSLMADIFAEMEAQNMRVSSVLMHARTYASVRKWGRDVLDIETQKTNLQLGLMARMWGAEIFLSVKVPEKQVCIFSDPEKSKTAIRLNLEEKSSYGINDLIEREKKLQEQFFEFYTTLKGVTDQIHNTISKLDRAESALKARTSIIRS